MLFIKKKAPYMINYVQLWLITASSCFFLRKLKKEKTKKKNYSRRKNVLVASFLRRSRTLSGEEA
jgi:hypothetical protein